MIDLRSDTVTLPTAKMRSAMLDASVGDDVYDEDPTVNKLQDFAAQLFNKQGALFFASGTQAALCALLTHCQRGDEYICGQQAHNFKYEGGGAAVLGGIQPQPITNETDGTLDIKNIEAAIKPDDFHFAKTKLISLENTIGGKPISLDYVKQVKKLADNYKLKMHLDGARIFNAATALNTTVDKLVADFDSITLCLSKGLAAPVGSLLIADKDFIKTAKRWRKVCGGGMRQAGFLAAAGLIALKESPARLFEDHDKATMLADSLKNLPQINAVAHTNMVFMDILPTKCETLKQGLFKQGFLAFINPKTRLVFHKDIPTSSIAKLAETIKLTLLN